MYFLGKSWRKQAPLWNLLEDDRLEIHQTNPAETRRMRALMEKYQDAPMDLADASLVATAETREFRRVFTLDSHFRIYRANDKEPFEVVP
jgi:predicted nucleic acid-binding protein